MDEAESGAPGRKKVPQSLLHKAKQFFILFASHLFALHMCCRNVIFHGIKEDESLETVCVEHVVCKCSG